MTKSQRPRVSVRRPTTPTYCSMCEAPNSLVIRMTNPKLVCPEFGMALCDKHALNLASTIIGRVRNVAP